MFEFRPELVDADDEEADDTRYIQGTGEDEVKEMQEDCMQSQDNQRISLFPWLRNLHNEL